MGITKMKQEEEAETRIIVKIVRNMERRNVGTTLEKVPNKA